MQDWKHSSDTQRFMQYLSEQRRMLVEQLLNLNDLPTDEKFYRHAYICATVHTLDQVMDIDTIIDRLEAMDND